LDQCFPNTDHALRPVNILIVKGLSEHEKLFYGLLHEKGDGNIRQIFGSQEGKKISIRIPIQNHVFGIKKTADSTSNGSLRDKVCQVRT